MISIKDYITVYRAVYQSGKSQETGHIDNLDRETLF